MHFTALFFVLATTVLATTDVSSSDSPSAYPGLSQQASSLRPRMAPGTNTPGLEIDILDIYMIQGSKDKHITVQLSDERKDRVRATAIAECETLNSGRLVEMKVTSSLGESRDPPKIIMQMKELGDELTLRFWRNDKDGTRDKLVSISSIDKAMMGRDGGKGAPIWVAK